MNRSRQINRLTQRFLRWGALVLVLCLGCGCTAAVSSSKVRMKVMVDRFFDPEEGIFPSLDDKIFGAQTRLAAIFTADNFAKAIGFWVFLTEPHRPKTIPVVLVSGHWTGPRAFRQLSESLDRDRFEPWFTYYPTGMSIKESARMLRKSLARIADYYQQEQVVVVALSQGGLVARQALMPADDAVEIPHVPIFIGVSIPWGGSAALRNHAERRIAADSWKETVDTSAYVRSIFDQPLPEATAFHMIYGVGGREATIPGRDDGVLSEATMGRPEAVREARSVTIVEHGTHTGILADPQTLEHVGALLGQLQ